MADPGAVNYIKEQFHAGYTEQEIRQALLEAGWSEKDIEDAFYVVLGKSEPMRPARQPQEGGPMFYGGSEYHSPFEVPGIRFDKPPEQPIQQPTPLAQPQAPSQSQPPVQPPAPVKPQKQADEPGWFRPGSLVPFIGGLLITANFIMVYAGMKDMLQAVYGNFSLISLAPDIMRIAVIVSGIGCLLSGIMIRFRPYLDLYFGVVVMLFGLIALLSGNGYMIGGVVSILGGSLAIVRK